MTKKLMFLVLSALLVLGLSIEARAELGATGYSGKSYYEQQVFVGAYNNYGNTIPVNSVVILDTAGTGGSSLGAYITMSTTSDSVYVFGVADESITQGEVGRICIRGPHQVKHISANATESLAAGEIVAVSNTVGQAREYATADGTAGGQLGIAIDSALTGATAWIWINPTAHK